MTTDRTDGRRGAPRERGSQRRMKGGIPFERHISLGGLAGEQTGLGLRDRLHNRRGAFRRPVNANAQVNLVGPGIIGELRHKAQDFVCFLRFKPFQQRGCHPVATGRSGKDPHSVQLPS